MGDFLLINMKEKKKARSIILLSREHISSRKALQAEGLHSQLAVGQQYCLSLGKSLLSLPQKMHMDTRESMGVVRDPVS